MKTKLKNVTVHYYKVTYNRARTEALREEVKSRTIRALGVDDAKRRFENGQKHGDIFTQFIDAIDDDLQYM